MSDRFREKISGVNCLWSSHALEHIVQLYKHEGFFKNTREEAWGAAECFSHLSSVLKSMHEDKLLFSFKKC